VILLVSNALKPRVRDSAMRGVGDMGGVFCEDTAVITRGGLFPGFPSLCKFRGGNLQSESALFGVDRDGVPFFDE